MSSPLFSIWFNILFINQPKNLLYNMAPLPEDHVYTDHIHPWEEIVHYVCMYTFRCSKISDYKITQFAYISP